MSPLLRLLGAGLALLLLQSLATSTLPAVLRPDLILLFALSMGLRSSGNRGLLLAFGFGFAVDVLSGSPPGLFALLRGTACAVTRLLDGVLYLRAPAPWAAYVAAYCVVDGVLMGITMGVFAPESATGWLTLLARLPGEALLTALVAAPLQQVFARLDREAERDGALSALPRV